MNNKGSFKKGVHYSPETEIKKGQHFSKKTEFKKGHVGRKRVATGTERFYRNDVYEKVNRTDWKLKKWIVYDKHYRKHNKNDWIIFLDGNRKNVTIDNMICVTKQVGTIMQRNGMISSIPEITYSNHLLAKLIAKQKNILKKRA